MLKNFLGSFLLTVIHFHANYLKQLKEHYKREIGESEAILHYYPHARNGPMRLVNPRDYVAFQFEGKVLEFRAHPDRPVDLLVCAVGSNDAVRDLYFGSF